MRRSDWGLLPQNPTEQPTEEIPTRPWRQFLQAFRKDFEQGQHVSILGPTDSGKTTVGIEVCECRDYVLFLATKKDDEIIETLRDRGYVVMEELEIEIRGGVAYPEKIVFWPKPWSQSRDLHEIHTLQKEQIRAVLSYVYDTGKWTVFADETLWLADKLKLGDDLEHLWYQGRSSEISVIAAAQRPAWVPRAMYSSADHIFIFQTNDHEDLRRLGDIGGLNVRRIRTTVAELDDHEFLYVGTRTGVLIRSKVEKSL